MILEGFEIENWSCIKKMSVTGLPATGVIVLHGPNRTGKSSIVQALCACLMDYQSNTNSIALKTCYPRGTGEKPVVSVTFQAGGTSYRIKKHFGSSKSELASKTSSGAWKVETTSSAEAHHRTCDYAGGNDSAKGLHQLLWLTQTEFQLPDPKKFDPNVQAQLRGILGVLQTSLDDRFIERVKKRWNVWYSGQRKAGKQQDIKDSCKLAENLRKLESSRKELQDSEGKFNEVEGFLRQAAELELRKLDLERQLGNQTRDLQLLREEHQRSQARIEARRRAKDRQTFAESEHAGALEEQRQRTDAAQRCLQDENTIEPARQKVETIGLRIKTEEVERDRLRRRLGTERDHRRDLQDRADRVAAKLRRLELREQLTAAQRNEDQAKEVAQEIARIETYLSENPAPGKDVLAALKANQQQISRLQADLEAASLNLTLVAEDNAAAARVAVDGSPFQELRVSGGPMICSVRRKAELHIGGWGRVEFGRGVGSGDLDQIEDELRQSKTEFADAIAPYGIPASEPRAMDLLMERASEHRIRTTVLDQQRKQLKQLAPKGLDPLRAKVVELQTKVADIPALDPAEWEPLPADPSELDKLSGDIKIEMETRDADIQSLDSQTEEAEARIASARTEETTAKEELATCKAKASSSCEELERMPTEAQSTQRVEAANRAVEEAELQLRQTELTSDERTIDERLEAAEGAVIALEQQSRDNNRKYDVIEAHLLVSEGLHARRSSLAARVDELTRVTERESLEKEAVDRLYALFEECRERQLGTLMGPIHDRVLGWMRVLDIGDYKEMRFNDAFLPDRLMTRDGTSEFAIHEESTGAQEQIGMLVRLALGSVLASADKPAVAILDDPLTHCDIGRLNKMRVILRRAAEGDQNLTPPAGPLQIVILTCHPEGFRDERATVIDLENPEVMSRWPV